MGLGPDMLRKFVPKQGESDREAKAICAKCPVLLDCREYAIQRSWIKGVWGGWSGRDRIRERRRRKKVADNGNK